MPAPPPIHLRCQRIAPHRDAAKTRRLARYALRWRPAVPEGDRTAVDVQGSRREFQITGAGGRLTREGLVQFDHVDGRDFRLGAQQGFLRRTDGADAHDIRRAARDRDADDVGGE